MNDEVQIRPQDIEDCIILMSMYHDIDWTRKNNEDICLRELDFSWPRRCGKVEWDRLLQTRWQMELRSRIDDDGSCTKRSPSLPMHKSFVQRNIGKSNWSKKFHTLQRGTSNHGVTVKDNHCR